MPKELDGRCGVCGVHEIYCCGSRVRISSRGADVLTEPLIECCPLHKTLYGANEIDAETVKSCVEKKIRDFGLCCRNRRFDSDPMVAYGASEMMSVWLEKGSIDCAVVVCDGAGTAITNNGRFVQGIGARLTGIVHTSPIQEVIERIERNGGHVLDKAYARIDQLEGVKLAVKRGFRHIAVSVAGFQTEAISEIRRFEDTEKIGVLVFSVCNTRVEKRDVKHITKSDLVCASASTTLRREIGKRALLQIGVTIPVYALTPKGKELALTYLAAFKDKLVVFRANQLPYDVRDRGPRMRTSTRK